MSALSYKRGYRIFSSRIILQSSHVLLVPTYIPINKKLSLINQVVPVRIFRSSRHIL